MNEKLSNFFRNRSIRAMVVSSNILLTSLAILIAIISFTALNQLANNASKSNILVNGLSEINKVSGELEKFFLTRNIQHVISNEARLKAFDEVLVDTASSHDFAERAELHNYVKEMITYTQRYLSAYEENISYKIDFDEDVENLADTIEESRALLQSKREQIFSTQNDIATTEREKQVALRHAYVMQDRIDRFLEVLPKISDRLTTRHEQQALLALNNLTLPIEGLQNFVNVADISKDYGVLQAKLGELPEQLDLVFKPGVGANAPLGELDDVWQSLRTMRQVAERVTTLVSDVENNIQINNKDIGAIDENINLLDKITRSVASLENAYALYALAPSSAMKEVLQEASNRFGEIGNLTRTSSLSKQAEHIALLQEKMNEMSSLVEKRNEQMNALVNASLEAGTLISSASKNSTQAAIDINKQAMIVSAAVVLLLIFSALATIYIISRAVAKPIGNMTKIMTRLAQGDMDLKTNFRVRHNEIGDMQNAVEVFHENAKKRVELEQTNASDLENKQQRQIEIDALIANFKEEASGLLKSFNEQANAMHETAMDMSQLADVANDQTGSAKDSTQESTASVQTVATAAEELSVATQEITRQVQTTSSIVEEGANNATNTSERISRLATSAQKIGDVVSLIQDIAEQTNLLALNATIEAARAGEQGRGFAVVASEVKSLAAQTSHATSEIAQQIGDIQAASDGAVEAILSINETMNDVKNHTQTISASVTQQASATQEISISAQKASDEAIKIADNISGVSTSVFKANESATVILDAANSLADNATVLNQHVDTFLKKVATV